MSAVYLLTLRQLSGKWRLLIMAVLATLPVLMAVIVLRDDDGPSVIEFEQVALSSILSGSILPMVVLAIATAAFSNEVEDRTLANLTLAPLPRWKIAIPKLLATMTLAAPFIGISAFLTSHVAFLADWRATIAVVLASLAAVALYAGARLPRQWAALVPLAVRLLSDLYIDPNHAYRFDYASRLTTYAYFGLLAVVGGGMPRRAGLLAWLAVEMGA